MLQDFHELQPSQLQHREKADDDVARPRDLGQEAAEIDDALGIEKLGQRNYFFLDGRGIGGNLEWLSSGPADGSLEAQKHLIGVDLLDGRIEKAFNGHRLLNRA